MNESNLKPVTTKSEARTRGRNGGIKSGQVRKQKKLMKEALSQLLGMKASNPTLLANMEKMGIKKADQTNQTLMLISMLNKAIKGDVKAAEFIRDTVGESPNNKELESSTPISITFETDYGDDEDDKED